MGSGNSDPVKAVASAAQSVGKNMERNAQNTLQGAGMILQGDWNNGGRTLLDAAIGAQTANMVNPDDINKVTGTQTAVQRKASDAAKAAADKQVQDAQDTALAAENKRLSTIASFLDSYGKQRSRSIGRAALLAGSPAPFTLLSSGGK